MCKLCAYNIMHKYFFTFSSFVAITGVRVLVDAREKLHIPWGDPSNQAHGETMMAFDTRSAMVSQGTMETKVFLQYLPSIRALWADSGIQNAYDRRREFQLVSFQLYFSLMTTWSCNSFHFCMLFSAGDCNSNNFCTRCAQQKQQDLKRVNIIFSTVLNNTFLLVIMVYSISYFRSQSPALQHKESGFLAVDKSVVLDKKPFRKFRPQLKVLHIGLPRWCVYI